MFWIVSVILILIALVFILPSLLKQEKLGDDTREQNIAIAKEQLADLESRFEKNEIGQDDYQEAKKELEFSLFNDLKNSTSHEVSESKKRGFSWLVFILIPLIAVPLYLQFGSLDYAEQVDPKVFAKKAPISEIPPLKDGTPDHKRMIASLKYELENDPTNFESWYILGRVYGTLKQHADAAEALEKALALKPSDVKTMLSLADALALSKKSKLTGRPRELLKKVLALEPNHLTALWLSGMAASQEKDFLGAVRNWQNLLPLLKDRPKDLKTVTGLIDVAKKRLNPSQLALFEDEFKNAAEISTASGDSGVKVSISLSDKLMSQVSPDDIVFIYAKAMKGPPMPLAAVKKQVKDLPMEIELNDRMAMMPSLTLSSFKDVSVGARVSKGGRPIAENGDLFGEKKNISLGDKVSIEIDSVYEK